MFFVGFNRFLEPMLGDQFSFCTTVGRLGPSPPLRTPPKLLETTDINLTTKIHTFQIPVRVIENFSSTVILGNEFLSSNEAIIMSMYKKNIIVEKY